MFLHLGKDTIVNTENIIAVLDMDTATGSRHTRAFLTHLEKKGHVINVTEDIPKSVVIYGHAPQIHAYICQLSSKTLLKRSRENTMLYSDL